MRQVSRRLLLSGKPESAILGANGMTRSSSIRSLASARAYTRAGRRTSLNVRATYRSIPRHLLTHFAADLPKDRLADALEAYVKSQDLVVWTSSSVQPKPTYNAESGRWSVTVLKNGTAVQLHPKHIVMATGFAGEPVAPKFLGQEKFEGEVFHSSRRPSVEYFAGKNIVVVGAVSPAWQNKLLPLPLTLTPDSRQGQSAADACHDFVRNGANKVTMVQRSATCGSFSTERLILR